MKNTRSVRPVRLAPFLGALLALALLTGCSRAEHAAPASSSPSSAAPAADGKAGVAALGRADRSLVVTIDTSLTVEDVDAASERLRAAVEKAGGFVADARTSGADGQSTAHLELRVPASEARSLRATIGELGAVTSSVEKVEDVTEERADLEARLVNARTQEKRLLEIMSEKTASIRDLVEAENELARVRENVERLEAQSRSMKSKIQLATVRVTLSTKSVAAWKTPGASIARAGRSGLEAAQALSVSLAMALAVSGPTLLPIVAVIAGIVVVVRRRRASAMAAMLG